MFNPQAVCLSITSIVRCSHGKNVRRERLVRLLDLPAGPPSFCPASTSLVSPQLISCVASQMAAYAVGRTPPPTLHWQHRRSESVKLIALMAGLLLVGGLVVASVRGHAH